MTCCNLPHHGGRHQADRVYYTAAQEFAGGPRQLIDGPWPTHREAFAALKSSIRWVSDRDPQGWFYLFGTASRPAVDAPLAPRRM